MTATPVGIGYLVEGVTFSPMRRRRRFGPRWPSWLRWAPLRVGVYCHRHLVGIGVKVKALVRLRAGDGDALGRRLPC